MNFVEQLSSSQRPVVIFGASVLGGIILDALSILNLQPTCFCDNDTTKQTELFCGHEVISFEKLCALPRDSLVVIAAGRYFKDIERQLIEAGFNRIYADSDVLSCIDFEKTPREKLERIIWHLAKLGKLSQVVDVPQGSLHIPRLNVVVTTRCTLKCEHCSSLMPKYKKQSDIDSKKVIASLERILTAADLIYHVELLGGETFLYKDFPLVAKYLLDSGKILHLDVITNGTILPSDNVLSSLKHPNLSVVIDDYGELSRKLGPLSEALKRLEIDYRINKHWAWADLGGFEARHRSINQMTGLFAACNFNSCTELLDGKLYRCPRSSHGTNTGLIQVYPEDFIDILEPSRNIKVLKEILRAFLYDLKYIQACNHCSGNISDSLTLTPAEQPMK